MAPCGKVTSISAPGKIRVMCDVKCVKCNKVVRNGILCDSCDRWNHFRCGNVIESNIPKDSWACPKCKDAESSCKMAADMDGVGVRQVSSNEASMLEVIAVLQDDLAKLQAENECLKANAVSGVTASLRPTDSGVATRGWESVPGRLRPNLDRQFSQSSLNFPPLKNRFDILNSIGQDDIDQIETKTDLHPKLPSLGLHPKLPRPICKPLRHQNKKTKITLYSDSQGRNLANLLNEQDYEVSSVVKPNATFATATNGGVATSLEPEDFTVLFAGTNDVGKNETNGLLHAMRRKLVHLQETNVIIVSVPQRFDLPSWSIVNKEVEEANRKIQLVCNPLKNVSFVDISKLDRRLHTRNGLHLNMFGKRYVADKIKCIITKFIESRDSPVEPIIPMGYNRPDSAVLANSMNKSPTPIGHVGEGFLG